MNRRTPLSTAVGTMSWQAKLVHRSLPQIDQGESSQTTRVPAFRHTSGLEHLGLFAAHEAVIVAN